MQPSENWGPTHKNIEKLRRRSSKLDASSAPVTMSIRTKKASEMNPNGQSNNNNNTLMLNGGPLTQIGTIRNGTVNCSDPNGSETVYKDNDRNLKQNLSNKNENCPLLKSTLSDPSKKRSQILDQNKPMENGQKSFDNPSFEIQIKKSNLDGGSAENNPDLKSHKSDNKQI